MVVRISSLSSSASAQGTLKVGQSVTFTAGVNQPVSVTGIPTLLLNDGGLAFYVAALSTPTILVFRYTVAPNDQTSDLSVVGLTTNGGSISAPGSLFFNNAINYDVGSQLTGIAAADVDGDNKPDLIVTDYANSDVSVLTNSGNGAAAVALGFNNISFSTATRYAAGPHPSAVALGDFNADGKIDLAITNQTDGTVTILRGDGHGYFELLGTDDTGSGPVSVTVAKLNNDAYPDLAIATGNKKISVLDGSNSGSFSDPATYGVGSSPSAIAAADIDGDGDIDLFVVNEHGNSVTELLNDGSGGFGHGTTYSVGSAPSAVVAVDVNGDGKFDLVVTDSSDNAVSVLLGDGHGGFGTAHSFDAGNTPVSIAVGDVDGDGKLDLVVADYGAGGVSVLQGVGDGTFLAPFLTPTGTHPVAVTVADLNGDGLLDVAAANGDGKVSVLQNNSLLPGDLAATSILLNLGIDTKLVVDAVPPGILTRTASPGTGSFGVGKAISITMSFSEAVSVTGTPVLTLNDGGTASYVSGSGSKNLVFTTTVAAGQNAANLAVTALALPGNATIFDVVGNAAVVTRAVTTFAGLWVDTTTPTITADTASPATGIYGAGQIINLTLTGSEPLTVTGTPVLTLNDGGTASYVSGSGSPNLVFRYTILFGQATANLAATGVTLPGGATIRDGAGNNAVLAGAPATFPGLVVNTTAPVVVSVAASPGTGSIEVGGTVTFTLTFSEAVKLSGAVVLTLNDGGTATYIGGAGASTTLAFQTTVAAGQNAAALTVTGISLPNGAYIRAAAGTGANAYLAGAVKTFGGLTVDTSGPTFRSLTTTPSDATLGAGAVITLNLLLSKIVSVAGGTPTLTLNDGAVAKYVSGSGTNTLVFSTTVVPGQITPDLAVTALNLNGATVADSQGRPADFTGAVANPPGTLEISAAAVTVISIIATPSTTGPLGVGRTVTFVATLGRAVTVTGAPVLTLNDGGTASYDAVLSTATKLVFHGTVAAGQNTPNLSVTGLTLNGAVVTVPNSPLAFTPPSGHVTGAYSEHMAIADANDDGQPDLLVAGNQTVSILLGDGAGGFLPAITIAASSPSGMAAVDMNHDNKADLVFGSQGMGIYVALGDGTGNFGTPTLYTGNGTVDVHPWSMAVGDMNGDGTPDVVDGDAFNNVLVLLGDGAGGLGTEMNAEVATGDNNTVALADVNGDGKLDVVSASFDFGVSIMLGDGHGGLGAPLFFADPDHYGAFGLAVADLNGDGWPDIAASFIYGDVEAWLNDGHGGFGAGVAFAAGIEPLGLAAADVNGDGKADLVVNDTQGGAVNVLLGDGLGVFGTATPFLTGYDPYALAVADVNNDGRPDIAVTRDLLVTGVEVDQREGTVSVLLNSTIAPNVFDPAGTAAALGAASGLVVDTTPPVILADSTAPERGSYDVGRSIDFTLTGSEPMFVTGLLTGAPFLTLNDGGTASYIGGSGTTSLQFRTTVAAGQNATVLAITGVTLPTGAAIRDDAGNDANLSGAVAAFDGLAVVTTSPSVKSVTANPAAGTFGAGAVVTFSVAMTKPVSVSRGVPTLALNDGGVARYVSGSGTDTLLFSTTIAAGQAASDLAVTGLSLNGAIIADRGGHPADFAGAVGNPVGLLIVAAAPVTITSIAATPSAAGPLGIGRVVSFAVTLGRAVTITGAPSLTLNDGGTAAYDTVASTPTSLVFRTTVAPGQNTPNLAVTALTLNGATIAVPGGFAFGAAVGFTTTAATDLPSTPSVQTDVDGDGRPDAVTVDPGANIVSVAPGLVGGGFGPAIDYPVGTNPQSVSVADVNKDGRQDLLVANQGDGTVSVLLGKLGGGFASAVAIAVNAGASAPRSVVPGDENGDDKLDLLVGTGTSVALLIGDGAGGFSPGGTGASPTAGTTADVNGDGFPDAIETLAGTNLVSIQPGIGNGGFGPAVTYAVGVFPHAVTAADLNNDGKPDLVVGNYSSGTVSILLNTGAGFAPATTVPVNNGISVPTAVTVADINGDGDPDILVAATTSVALLLGDGAGGFSAAGSFATGFGTSAVATADVNGDGRLDLIATFSGDDDQVAGGVSVLLGTAGGFGNALNLAAGSFPNSLAVADLNGDGTPDLIVGNELGGDVSVLLGNGFGGFLAAVGHAVGVGPTAVAVADLNGDGRPDLAIADSGRIEVLLGDGAGGFGPGTHYAAGNSQLVSITAVDLNGDGLPDLVAASGGGSVFSLLNQSAAPGIFSAAGLGAAPGASTGLVVDSTALVVLSDTPSPAAGVFNVGQVLAFTLATSEAVIVTGTPVLTLNDGGTATYVSGSGTTNLVFQTTVAAGQNAPVLAVTGVTLPAGATMTDVAGNAADLAGAVATFAGVAVDTSLPSIAGTVAGQGVADNGTIRPFASALLLDSRLSPSETITIALTSAGVATDADGLLAGVGLTHTGIGSYALAAGSPTAVTAALRALLFTPTANQVTPGAAVTTGFSLSLSDGGPLVVDTTTSVHAVSVNDDPVVGGTVPVVVTTDVQPVNPFAAVTVADADVGQTETATVTFSPANGTLSNTSGPIPLGPYAISGTAAEVQAAVRSLVFTPTLGLAPPGQTVMTNFRLAVNDGFTTTLNQSTSVAATSIACYAAGTRILTAQGERRVETLRAGDLVVTLAGPGPRLQPIRWIGHSRIDLARHPRAQSAAPIRFETSALAPGVPHRPLLVSPEHAMLVGDVLIPAYLLVNGASIRHQPASGEIRYFHVELERHDLLLAEGAAAETYLDTGNRGLFANGSGAQMLHPEFAQCSDHARRCWSERACRRLHVEGPAVEAAHATLLARAETLGHCRAKGAQPSLQADGVPIPLRATATGWTALLPHGTRTLRLRSRAMVPNEMRRGAGDARRLGMPIASLRHDDTELPDAALTSGFHPREHGPSASWCWTDGDATVELTPRSQATRFEIVAPDDWCDYWLPPADLHEAVRTHRM